MRFSTIPNGVPDATNGLNPTHEPGSTSGFATARIAARSANW